jgi:hypothetical protein
MEDRTLTRASDNDFFLGVGESRPITLHVRVKDKELGSVTVSAGGWNCEEQTLQVCLS